MTTQSILCHDLSDRDLLAEVMRRCGCERHGTAGLIASLMELDARQLYLGEGCSSLFTYCTQILHLSEHAAYGRIEAARAARRVPLLLDLLANGSITLTTVCLLSPLLTPANHREVLDSARHKSKREVEQMVAALRPQPPVPAVVRKLPTPHVVAPPGCGPSAGLPGLAPEPVPRGSLAAPVSGVSAIAPTSVPEPAQRREGAVRVSDVKPLTTERYKVQFTIGRETHDTLRRAQDLLRHQVPTGDPAAIFEKALTLLVAQLERAKLGKTERPHHARATRPGARHVPAAVRRAVWARDQGRCAFEGARGRCRETGFLELHHLVPFAAGGATTVENLELRCRAHNAFESQKYFGRAQPVQHRAPTLFTVPSNSEREKDCVVDANLASIAARAGDRSR
jgi:hypothetical protein